MAVVGVWVVGVGSFPEMEDVFPEFIGKKYLWNWVYTYNHVFRSIFRLKTIHLWKICPYLWNWICAYNHVFRSIFRLKTIPVCGKYALICGIGFVLIHFIVIFCQ
jgi:hypothetical protein